MTPHLTERLGKLLPMLASDREGEVIATVAAIRRTLAAGNLDLHDLAKVLTDSSTIKGSDWFSDIGRQARQAAERAEAERAAKAAARAAWRASPEFKAKQARRREARARRAADDAAAAARYARERAEHERILREGPKWHEISDAARRAWLRRILDDQALDAAFRATLDDLNQALTPRPRRGGKMGWRPSISSAAIAPEWIATFESAARQHAARNGGRQ